MTSSLCGVVAAPQPAMFQVVTIEDRAVRVLPHSLALSRLEAITQHLELTYIDKARKGGAESHTHMQPHVLSGRSLHLYCSSRAGASFAGRARRQKSRR